MSEDILEAHLVVVVFEPAALREIDCDGGEAVSLRDVVDQVEGEQLIVFVGVNG